MTPEELKFSPEDFSGTARLFPLPNLVVFPHVMQPLHIFEPRYRAMLEEALADDGLIAMAVLAPGWEKEYEGRPPIRPTACLCRVATHHQTDDGKYNILLVGLRRIHIDRELPPTKLFREASATLIEDVYPPENADRRAELQGRLVSSFRRVLSKLPEAQQEIERVLSSEVPLGALTDILAYTLNIDQQIKEDLLSQPLPDLRALLLLQCLTFHVQAAGSQAPGHGFPPDFSKN